MSKSLELLMSIKEGDKEASQKLFKSIMIDKLKVEADLKKREIAQTIFTK